MLCNGRDPRRIRFSGRESIGRTPQTTNGTIYNGNIPYLPALRRSALGAAMADEGTTLSHEEAVRFHSYERQRHDSLATTYHDFFTPVTMLAIKPLLRAVQIRAGSRLLDVATGPGSFASAATKQRPLKFSA
jgi:hypothetical protein